MVTIQKMKCMARQYIDFPKYTIWGILANSLAFQGIIILISIYYGIAILGLYSLIERVLNVPMALIGNSIGQVYTEEASREKTTTNTCTNTFKNTFKKLFFLSTPLFLILFFIIEFLFGFIFGEEWIMTGTYAKILLPYFYIRFLVLPLISTDSIMGKQKFFLIFQIIVLISAISTIYFFHYLAFEKFLLLYSSVMTIIYLVYLIVLYYFSCNKSIFKIRI